MVAVLLAAFSRPVYVYGGNGSCKASNLSFTNLFLHMNLVRHLPKKRVNNVCKYHIVDIKMIMKELILHFFLLFHLYFES